MNNRAEMLKRKMEQRRRESLQGFTVPRPSSCKDYGKEFETKTSSKMKRLYRQRIGSLIFLGIMGVIALAICIISFGKGMAR